MRNQNIDIMKGIVFTEFLEMVESSHGYELVDQIIEDSDLPSNGIYTSIGTYPHTEIVQLVVSLSQRTGVAVPALLHTFGRYLFDTFLKNYPGFFDAADNAFDFFGSIQEYIHVEVLKLYPDAQLPEINTVHRDEKQLHLVYESDRKMSTFALGLLEKGLEHYKENAEIVMENLEEDGSKVLFKIMK